MLKSITKIPRSTLLIIGLAMLLRLLLLDIKPPHFDEGVNGWFVDQMTKTGYYEYDPKNYHGPLHFYVLFLSQTLFGRNLWALRLPIVAVSGATVGLVLLFERFIGRRAAQFAALAMAVSPAMVFYGRYAIHESWLVFFLILMVWGLAGLWKHGMRGYLWALGLGITGAVLIKETYIIHFACFGLAAACLWLLEMWMPSADMDRPVKQQWSNLDVIVCVLVCVSLVIFFYSGGFLDWHALKGLYLTFAAWSETGEQGHGHEKTAYDIVLNLVWKKLPLGFFWKSGTPPTDHSYPLNYYWLYLMALYERPALIGFGMSLLAVLPRTPRLGRYLAIYGVGTVVAYSLIPYKTPWCIISLLWPFFFLLGYLVDFLNRSLHRTVALGVTLILLVASLPASIRLNFFHYTDDEEPYVYVQTFKDIYKLVNPLLQNAKTNPVYYHLKGHIIVTSYHPLPWMLGDFTSIGYYDSNNTPSPADADFLLVEESRVEEIEADLHQSYFTDQVQIRAAQSASKLYLNAKTFHNLFPNRVPELLHEESDSPAETTP